MKSQHGHHVTPKKTLFLVFGALVFLTILTAVTATQLDLGAMNVPVALLIAGTKAGLVAMFFMALKYDNPVNTLVFSLGIAFVVVFLTFTLFDTAFRGDLGNVGTSTISEMDRLESIMRDREEDFPDRVGTGLGLVGTEGDTTAADAAAADTAAAPDTAAADTAAAPDTRAAPTPDTNANP